MKGCSKNILILNSLWNLKIKEWWLYFKIKVTQNNWKKQKSWIGLGNETRLTKA